MRVLPRNTSGRLRSPAFRAPAGGSGTLIPAPPRDGLGILIQEIENFFAEEGAIHYLGRWKPRHPRIDRYARHYRLQLPEEGKWQRGFLFSQASNATPERVTGHVAYMELHPCHVGLVMLSNAVIDFKRLGEVTVGQLDPMNSWMLPPFGRDKRPAPDRRFAFPIAPRGAFPKNPISPEEMSVFSNDVVNALKLRFHNPKKAVVRNVWILENLLSRFDPKEIQAMDQASEAPPCQGFEPLYLHELFSTQALLEMSHPLLKWLVYFAGNQNESGLYLSDVDRVAYTAKVALGSTGLSLLVATGLFGGAAPIFLGIASALGVDAALRFGKLLTNPLTLGDGVTGFVGSIRTRLRM